MAAMKHRHAAAFALVGWYLIAPPIGDTNVISVNKNAPLAKWEILESYDTARECEREKIVEWTNSMRVSKNKRLDDVVYGRRVPQSDGERLLAETTVKEMTCECVASDDPRLKEK
jgi:hypothetical protein